MTAMHVVLPKIGTESDLQTADRLIKARWLRLRTRSLLRRLDSLGLSWTYEHDPDEAAVYMSDALRTAIRETQEEVLKTLWEGGIDTGAYPRTIFTPRTFDEIIASHLEIRLADSKRIARSAKRLTGYEESTSQKVDQKQIDRLAQASGPIPIAGPQTVDAVDEMWSEIHALAPWLSSATAAMWRAMRGTVSQGNGPALPPMLLYGAPGLGKTTLPRLLAKASGAPIVELDAGLSTAAFRVAGLDQGWSSSYPGEPLRAIVENRVANPIVIVNEIDRIGGGTMSSRGTASSLNDALLTFLDRDSAARFRCPFYGRVFDMSKVTWVLTANDLNGVDPVLLTRVQRYETARPTPEHVSDIVWRRLSDIDAVMAADAARMIERKWRLDGSMTLRQVTSLIERISAATLAPRLH